jgi:integrase
MGKPSLKLADDTTRKPPRRINFTKRALEAIKPTTTETTVYDEKQGGLAFRVRAGGNRAFYLIRKHKGRALRLKLGDWPDMSVEQARKAALDAIHSLAHGKNPADERRVARGEMTINALWALYLAEHLTPNRSARTVRAETYLFNKYLKPRGGRRLGDFSPASARTLHQKIGEASKVSANRAIQLLRRLYRYARRNYDYSGIIPTDGVTLFNERSRERFLQPDELQRFLAAADAEGQPWADFFRLALLTGGRRSNVQAMRWAALDLVNHKWVIPASESKNQHDMTVPLTAPAVVILKRRKAAQAASKRRDKGSAYVFPAMRDKGGTMHLSQPARPFDRICERAGIVGLTIHDLRRTAGAMLAAGGASLPVIGKALGHADLRATAIYARLDLDPVRQAMEAAAVSMSQPEKPKAKAGKGKKGGNRRKKKA